MVVLAAAVYMVQKFSALYNSMPNLIQSRTWMVWNSPHSGSGTQTDNSCSILHRWLPRLLWALRQKEQSADSKIQVGSHKPWAQNIIHHFCQYHREESSHVVRLEPGLDYHSALLPISQVESICCRMFWETSLSCEPRVKGKEIWQTAVFGFRPYSLNCQSRLRTEIVLLDYSSL